MRVTYFVTAFLLAPIVVRADIVSVPPSAVRSTQQWLDARRATDPALDGARLGNGYVTMSMSPRRTLDFLRSENATDPTEFADTLGREFHFPIIKADSCFGTINVIWAGELGRYAQLGQLEHQPLPLDVIVVTLDHLVAKGSHRTWVFQTPWPLSCSTVIAEKPDGQRLAFEFDYPSTEAQSESALMELGEPVASWAARLRTRLRTLYVPDQPVRRAAHEVPDAARREAERVVVNLALDEQRRAFAVSGPAKLGEPWTQFQLSPVELLLYAESDEIDPTYFDQDPGYFFPVLVEGQAIAVARVMGRGMGCGQVEVNEAHSEYMASAFSTFRPGSRTEWRPSSLATLGDVALLDVEFDRWYYIVGDDSTWIARYYPRDAEHMPQPIASIAKSLKEKIRAQYSK